MSFHACVQGMLIAKESWFNHIIYFLKCGSTFSTLAYHQGSLEIIKANDPSNKRYKTPRKTSGSSLQLGCFYSKWGEKHLQKVVYLIPV